MDNIKYRLGGLLWEGDQEVIQKGLGIVPPLKGHGSLNSTDTFYTVLFVKKDMFHNKNAGW